MTVLWRSNNGIKKAGWLEKFACSWDFFFLSLDRTGFLGAEVFSIDNK